MVQKFTKVERDSRQISDRDNCFTFSTPDGQLLMRCDGQMFVYNSKSDFEQLFRQQFPRDRDENNFSAPVISENENTNSQPLLSDIVQQQQ